MSDRTRFWLLLGLLLCSLALLYGINTAVGSNLLLQH